MTKSEILQKLERDLEVRGRSPMTVKDYKAKVRLFQDYHDKPADQMSENEIISRILCKEKPRYVKEQIGIVMQTCEDYGREKVLQGVEYCRECGLYSANDLRDAVESMHGRSEPKQAEARLPVEDARYHISVSITPVAVWLWTQKGTRLRPLTLFWSISAGTLIALQYLTIGLLVMKTEWFLSSIEAIVMVISKKSCRSLYLNSCAVFCYMYFHQDIRRYGIMEYLAVQ